VLARAGAVREAARTLVRERYLDSRGHRSAHGTIEWGALDASTGYLAVRSMARQSGRADGPGEDQQAAAATLTRAMEELGDRPSLVLDVRDNNGGYDGVALRIAGHFIDRRRLAFTKAPSQGAGFGGRQSVCVEPRGQTRYRGRIFLLTSSLTVSAAEILVLALLRHPRVTRIGEPTCGVLSDVMERHLPNGWRLSLSNELYRASDGELYEDRGIPPQVTIPFARRADLEAGRDPALDHVLAKAARERR
jgi:C-terminal processing protease CtpA/Prc